MWYPPTSCVKPILSDGFTMQRTIAASKSAIRAAAKRVSPPKPSARRVSASECRVPRQVENSKFKVQKRGFASLNPNLIENQDSEGLCFCTMGETTINMVMLTKPTKM